LVYQSYIQYDEADTSTKTLVSERIYNDELPVLTSSMKKGMTWGSASSTTTTDYNLDPPIINEPGRHVIWQYTLLDVEDVTVPYDNGRADNNPTTYNGCLKISRNRFEGTGVVSMEWYCPNMGLVKRVSASVTALLTEVN
jgi:hypothetical protein